MTREETLKAIAVMQHYADGGEVEHRSRDDYMEGWLLTQSPFWDWGAFVYRIKKTTKKIKLEAWMDVSGELRWFSEREDIPENCFIRLRGEDKWVEVEE